MKREGLLALYKASWGIRLINSVGKKYKKTLSFFSYVSVAFGYILMAAMVYLFGRIVYFSYAFPSVIRAIKVPPIMPLVPYIDKLIPGIPPFYFAYWIVILALIAITHEFAHGIFSIHNDVKIKTTGFGFFPYFLPVFLAAFVELDEKKMEKKPIFSQLSILSAGTFANVLTAVLFFAVLWLFFISMFVPAGVTFNTYSYSAVGIANITMINNISVNNLSFERFSELTKNSSQNNIAANKKNYVGVKSFVNINGKLNKDYIFLYDDYPAIKAKLSNTILKINQVETVNYENFQKELLKHSPGETVTLTMLEDDSTSYSHDIVLGTHPEDENKPWLGIRLDEQKRSGVMGRVINWLGSFKKSNVYYKPRFDGFSMFIYDLLWWIVLISVSVALVNMLPVGIFDGGRFFYLSVLALTKSEKTAKRAYGFMTWLFLFLLVLIMVFWAMSFF